MNVPNDGFIEGLPADIAVEVPAVIDGKGVRGVSLDCMPPSFLGLLQNQVGVHMMTTEAVLSKSKKAAVQAFLVDPVVTKAACAAEVVELMIQLQSKYLGYLK